MKEKSRGQRGKRQTAGTLKNGAAVALVALSTLSVYRAVAATSTIPILARIIRAIQITVNTSMQFGSIAVTGAAEAHATLDPATDAVHAEGEGGLILMGGAPKAGRLMIKGSPLPVHVSLADQEVYLTNGTARMTVRDFNFGTLHHGPETTVTPGGPDDVAFIKLGASLKTHRRQLSGSYIGKNTIFANYQ